MRLAQATAFHKEILHAMIISIDRAKREAKRWAKRIRSSIQCFLLSFPRNVECALCGWGRKAFHF
jgi:hypothetical protein